MLTSRRMVLFFALMSVFSCDRGRNPKTEEERLLYMMGQVQAENLAYLKLSEYELEILIKGMKDHAFGRVATDALNFREYGTNLKRYADRRVEKAADEEKREGKKLSDILLKQGGKVLSTGLTYKILALGNEKRAGDDASVEIHLHQTLRNKNVIYSTLDHGKKERFKVRDLLPGLRLALELVGEGGELQLVLPSDLAYGNRGLPPEIPGGASISTYMKVFRIL